MRLTTQALLAALFGFALSGTAPAQNRPTEKDETPLVYYGKRLNDGAAVPFERNGLPRGVRRAGDDTTGSTQPPASSTSLAGEWEAKDPTGRYAPATWKLTDLGGGRYKIEQLGFAPFRGTGVVDGKRLRVDFTTTTGWVGRADLTIDGPQIARGKVILTFNGNETGRYDYELHRIGAPPASGSAGVSKTTGTWDLKFTYSNGAQGATRIGVHPGGIATNAQLAFANRVGEWWEQGGKLYLYWGGPFPKTNLHYVLILTLSSDGRSMSSSVANYYTKSIEGVKLAPPTPGTADFSGVWDALDGGNPTVVILNQTGNRVTGTYFDGRGTMEGTVTGRTLRVRWMLQRPGDGEMTLSEDGNSYTGKWSAPNEPGGTWSGKRKLGAAAGGSLVATGDPASVLSGDWQDKDPTGLHAPSKWTFTSLGGGRYSVQQTGHGNFTGTATLTGNRLRLEWATTNGFAGNADHTFAADWMSAKGTFEITKGPINVGKYPHELYRMPVSNAGPGTASGNPTENNTRPGDAKPVNPNPSGLDSFRLDPPKPGEELISMEGPTLPAAPLPLPPVGKDHKRTAATPPNVRLVTAAAGAPPLSIIKEIRTSTWPVGNKPENTTEFKIEVELSAPGTQDDRVELYVGGYLDIDRSLQKGMRPAYWFGEATRDQNGKFYGGFGIPEVLPAEIRAELYHKGQHVSTLKTTFDLDIPDFSGIGGLWSINNRQLIRRVLFLTRSSGGSPGADLRHTYQIFVWDVNPKREVAPFGETTSITNYSFNFAKFMPDGPGVFDTDRLDPGVFQPIKVRGNPDWATRLTRIWPKVKADRDWRNNYIWPELPNKGYFADELVRK